MPTERNLLDALHHIEQTQMTITVADWTMIRSQLLDAQRSKDAEEAQLALLQSEREIIQAQLAEARDELDKRDNAERSQREYYERGAKKLLKWAISPFELSEIVEELGGAGRPEGSVRMALALKLGVPYDWLDILLGEAGVVLPIRERSEE